MFQISVKKKKKKLLHVAYFYPSVKPFQGLRYITNCLPKLIDRQGQAIEAIAKAREGNTVLMTTPRS